MDDAALLNMSSPRQRDQLNKQPSKSIASNSFIPRNQFANVEELFLQLLKNYPEGSISIIDKNFNVIYTGGELYQQLKKDPLSVTGKCILSMFPLTLQKTIQSRLSEVFSGQIVSDLELRDCCFAEHSYTMDGFPLLEEDRSVKRAGIIIRNITRLKQAEEGFRIALEKEKELGAHCEKANKYIGMNINAHQNESVKAIF